MSSEKTPKMNMHRWIDSDYFNVDEINENFSKLDNVGGTDFIVEKGSGETWSWIKWNSGRVELFVECPLNISSWNPMGVLFYTVVDTSAVPSGVVNGTSQIIANSIIPIYPGGGCYFTSQMRPSTNKITFDVVTGENIAVFNGYVRIYAEARWK